MRVRQAATALLALAVLGCGGRAATSPVSNPADRPAASTAAPRATPAHPARHVAPQGSDPATGTPVPEVRHTLRHGQTLYSLARLYDIPLDALMAANGIDDPRAIPEGTVILIPGARVKLAYRPAADQGATPDDTTQDGGSGGDEAHPDAEEDGDGENHGDGSGAPTPRHTVRAGPAAELQWPLHGAITGTYGRRGRNGHHGGVDIDGRRGDPIVAAASGVVVSAGTEGRYGRRVTIDHGDGIVTLYAHADRLLVHAGEHVHAGQPIAEVGRSGNARGTHLHFEVRRDGRAVDPIPYLRDTGLLTAGID